MKSPKNCKQNEIHSHFNDLISYMKEQASLQSQKKSNSSKGLDKFINKKNILLNEINKNASPKKISKVLISFFNELSNILYGNGNNVKIKGIQEIFESLKKNNIINKLNDFNLIQTHKQINQNSVPYDIKQKLNKLQKNHQIIENDVMKIQNKMSMDINSLKKTIKSLDNKIPDGELEKRIENVINREFKKINLEQNDVENNNMENNNIENNNIENNNSVNNNSVNNNPVNNNIRKENVGKENVGKENVGKENVGKENIEKNTKYFGKVIPYEMNKYKITEKQEKLLKILEENTD